MTTTFYSYPGVYSGVHCKVIEDVCQQEHMTATLYSHPVVYPCVHCIVIGDSQELDVTLTITFYSYLGVFPSSGTYIRW